MGHCFSHLTKTDRYKLQALLNRGVSKKDIASELRVHVSTIYKELKRSGVPASDHRDDKGNGYNPEKSHKRYCDNLAAKGPALKFEDDKDFTEYIVNKIKNEHYSPAAALHDIPNLGLSFNTSIIFIHVHE